MLRVCVCVCAAFQYASQVPRTKIVSNLSTAENCLSSMNSYIIIYVRVNEHEHYGNSHFSPCMATFSDARRKKGFPPSAHRHMCVFVLWCTLTMVFASCAPKPVARTCAGTILVDHIAIFCSRLPVHVLANDAEIMKCQFNYSRRYGDDTLSIRFNSFEMPGHVGWFSYGCRCCCF